MKSALINGMMGGFMGFLMSFLLNYFIFALPQNITINALGNGMSGLISGFMGRIHRSDGPYQQREECSAIQITFNRN